MTILVLFREKSAFVSVYGLFPTRTCEEVFQKKYVVAGESKPERQS